MNSLPRIKWAIGQTLLPEHMTAMEESVISDAAVRSNGYGLPSYGFAGLVLARSLQTDGLLTVDAGIIVMRSGRLLTVGGNSVINTINLNNSGEATVDIYIHLLNPSAEDGRGVPKAIMSHDVMQTWKYNLCLSFDNDIENTKDYLKLGRFKKDIDSQWQITEDYVPPLLEVSREGYISSQIKLIRSLLDNYSNILSEECAGLQIAGENLISVKRCLLEVNVYRQFIANTLNKVSVHPYHLYEMTYRLYLEICSYQGTEPMLGNLLYDHDNLSGTLLKLIDGTISLFEKEKSVIPMIEFTQSGGLLQVELTEECLRAEKWFILVQKPETHWDTSLIVSTKIASEPRLNIVHKYFLQGVSLSRIERPVFKHFFGPEIDVYEILDGEEWSRALADRSVAFLDDPKLASLKFLLYWSKN